MIAGFIEETQPLTEAEQNILPVIVKGLLKKQGASNAVTNKQICAGLLKTLNVEISEARVRKIINHIRMHGLVVGLVATSSGYFVTDDLNELRQYDKSLEGRENAIVGLRQMLKKYIETLENNRQHQLFNQ